MLSTGLLEGAIFSHFRASFGNPGRFRPAGQDPPYSCRVPRLRRAALLASTLTGLAALEPTAAAGPLGWSIDAEVAGGAEVEHDRSGGVGEASVSAEVFVGGDPCKAVATGGRLGLRERGGGDRAVTGEHRASACLGAVQGDLRVVVAEVSHRLEVGARPPLSSPPLFRSSPFVRERMEFTWGAVRMDDQDTDQHITALDLRPGVTLVRSAPGADLEAAVDVGMHLLRWWDDSPDQVAAIEALGVRLDFSPAGQTVTSFTLFAVEGWVIAPRLEMDLDVRLDAGSVDEGDQAVNIGGWAGSAGLATRRGPLLVGLAFERAVLGSWVGGVVADDRLAARVAVEGGRGAAELRGFLARSALYTAATGMDASVEPTGGASIELRARRWAGVEIGFTGEVARSFYARLDGGAAPVAGVGATALVTVGGAIGPGAATATPR